MRELLGSFPITGEKDLPLLDQAQEMHQAALLTRLDLIVGGEEIADQHAGVLFAQQCGDHFAAPATINMIDQSILK